MAKLPIKFHWVIGILWIIMYRSVGTRLHTSGTGFACRIDTLWTHIKLALTIIKTFRVAAPRAAQRTAWHKDEGSAARPIMNAERLNIKNASLKVFFVVRYGSRQTPSHIPSPTILSERFKKHYREKVFWICTAEDLSICLFQNGYIRLLGLVVSKSYIPQKKIQLFIRHFAPCHAKHSP